MKKEWPWKMAIEDAIKEALDGKPVSTIESIVRDDNKVFARIHVPDAEKSRVVEKTVKITVEEY